MIQKQQPQLTHSVGAFTHDVFLLNIARTIDAAMKQIGKAKIPTDQKDHMVVEVWRQVKPKVESRIGELREELEAIKVEHVPVRERVKGIEPDAATVQALGSLDYEQLRKTLRENPTDANIAAARKLEEVGKIPSTLLDALDTIEKAQIDRQNEAVQREIRNLEILQDRIGNYEKLTVAPAKERLQELKSAEVNIDSILRGL